MSMALWIWLASEKRLVGELSTLMFHDLSVFAIDTTEGIKQELIEMLRLQNLLVTEILSKSIVKEETLQDYITRKAEWYIPADEAIKLKLADGYYSDMSKIPFAEKIPKVSATQESPRSGGEKTG